MNPFNKFGIEHLSPSSLNQFATVPAVFILQRVLLRGGNTVGAAAHRGTAVELGISNGLTDPTASLTDCIQIAQTQFNNLTALSVDPRKEKEYNCLAGMVEVGLKELKPYGVPIATQGQVSYDVEGLSVPIIGFYDFLFPNGILIDLKTTHAVPDLKGITSAHARQVALYTACVEGVKSPRISYVSSKKSSTLALENAAEHLKALTRIALSVQKFLSVSDDPLELASMLSVDADSFYLSDPATRQAAFEVYGV